MSAPRLVPCLDVTDQGVVKGVAFQGLRAVGDPLELAEGYDRDGADEIVLLHVRATLDGRSPAVDLVRRLARSLRVPLTVGGGIRSDEDAYRLLEAGADRIAVNSAALADPSLIGRLAGRYGRQAVVVAVDYRTNVPDRPVRTRAAEAATAWRLSEWLRQATDEGAGEFLLTAIDRDGTGGGYDLEGLAAARRATDLPLIASGGAGSVDDVAAVLAAGLADAALLASRLHAGELTVRGLRAALREREVEVRWDRWTATA